MDLCHKLTLKWLWRRNMGRVSTDFILLAWHIHRNIDLLLAPEQVSFIILLVEVKFLGLNHLRLFSPWWFSRLFSFRQEPVEVTEVAFDSAETPCVRAYEGSSSRTHRRRMRAQLSGPFAQFRHQLFYFHLRRHKIHVISKLLRSTTYLMKTAFSNYRAIK